ncbi:uncharacterized protein LOC108022063 [Drosophila biarmipes]|uniref:uncharacterized protein LOC108022063 n=1 Tax=Drosophila biarmipes TaxID=125945 RepID=UPI001CDAAD8D|nr:uncharacterized protein LOC108022063 [Drosophila biarmipes]
METLEQKARERKTSSNYCAKFPVSSEMDLHDSLTSSQISKFEDFEAAAGAKKNTSHNPSEYFLRGVEKWQQLSPKQKIKYLIKMRVQTSQERKTRELAMKKNSRENPLQNIRSRKLRPKRKVILVEPSSRILRPKMIARRPTPLPSPRKRQENRSKTLPKYVPYRQKSSKL